MSPRAVADAPTDEVRSKPASRGRKELMAIAIDCFARYGYQGTSIDRIANAAGVAVGPHAATTSSRDHPAADVFVPIPRFRSMVSPQSKLQCSNGHACGWSDLP
jgi:hypothetical protein